MRSSISRLAVVLAALAWSAAASAQVVIVPGTGIVRISPPTVLVPDGGTAVIGGITRVSEGRTQFGAPILGQVPGVNRGFANVGYGRSVTVGRATVSVRIIDLAEEEFRQTGYRSR